MECQFCGHQIFWEKKYNMWVHGVEVGSIKCPADGCTCRKATPRTIDRYCPKCRSMKYRRDGIRKNKGPDTQRYKCLDCGHRYTEN